MHLSISNKNISPYLIEGFDFAITNRSKPICNITSLKTGNKPVDGGHYIFTETEKKDFIAKEPLSIDYIKPFIGANEFMPLQAAIEKQKKKIRKQKKS